CMPEMRIDGGYKEIGSGKRGTRLYKPNKLVLN
ncbi:MAG: hypothetical protein ACI8Z7_000801, partial [Candidatus Nanohaloarchaea archaeon]